MLFGISTALLTALAITLMPIKVANAQGARKVHIALVDSLSAPDARAEVVRFSGARPDLILLRSSDVSRDDLAAAIAAYENVRGHRPDRPGLIARTTIVGVGRPSGAPPRIADVAGSILRELKASPRARIGNLGHGRWGEFDVSR